jgi:quinoprotein glucose dehydrogenase
MRRPLSANSQFSFQNEQLSARIRPFFGFMLTPFPSAMESEVSSVFGVPALAGLMRGISDLFIIATIFFAAQFPASAQQMQATTPNSTNTADAVAAMKGFQVWPGLKLDLWAAEPLLANPVAFNFDEHGRVFLCETFRLGAGVDDIRGIMDWLDEELACRTVEDRLAEMHRHLGDRFKSYSDHSERIRVIGDQAQSGKADYSKVFAEGFNTPLDGIGAGVLPWHDKVWYANIPNLWLLTDTNHDGVADQRKSLHYGFGVRVGFLGHDLHGVHFGPDGRIYFSIGDRGSNIRVADGKNVGDPDSGCVFRCNPDGTELEEFAHGLRNPQDLVFDQYGNLFTGDNNSDSGDEARWVYLVEGSDNGWRVGYQFMEAPYSRGPFNAEKLWHPQFPGQAAYIVPPIANLSSGPSGVAYFPGTGLPQSFSNHFFLVDFRGGAANSGIHTFTLKARGAGYALEQPEHFVWGTLATDAKFGPDGGLYFTDWVDGWAMPGKGRIYRAHDPALDKSSRVLQTKAFLNDGMGKRSVSELAELLGHPDIRVRQEAQFELAARGETSVSRLIREANSGPNQLARIHAAWALGQILRQNLSESRDARSRVNGDWRLNKTKGSISDAIAAVTKLLTDRDPELRSQALKIVADVRLQEGYAGAMVLLSDSQPRVRFFAALAVGKLRRPESVPAISKLLNANADADPYLRHAAVMALVWINDFPSIMAAAKDSSASVRMGALLAMRRLQRSDISLFLHDPEPALVLEAARAINDEPIPGATKELADLIGHVPVKPATDKPSADEEALMRRALNANLRFGTPETATALAHFAASEKNPAPMRLEAIEQLSAWAHPSGRDRVIGLWRPVPGSRDIRDAATALESAMGPLLAGPAAVQKAALVAARTLNVTNCAPQTYAVFTNKTVAAEVRSEALTTLSLTGDTNYAQALDAGLRDEHAEVRMTATRLASAAGGSLSTIARLQNVLANGEMREKQGAIETFAKIQGPVVDQVFEGLLADLKSGKLAKDLQLEVLESAALRKTPSIEKALAQYRADKKKEGSLAPFEEALHGGNAELGKKIFFDRPEAQCVRCHKVNGTGGDVGPDLSHVAAQKPREYLLESIVLPNKQIAPGFESVLVTLKSDESYAGVVKSETDSELVLNSTETGVLKLKKSEIKSRRASLSPMPDGLGQILTKSDLRNLVEFLASLK